MSPIFKAKHAITGTGRGQTLHWDGNQSPGKDGARWSHLREGREVAVRKQTSRCRRCTRPFGALLETVQNWIRGLRCPTHVPQTAGRHPHRLGTLRPSPSGRRQEQRPHLRKHGGSGRLVGGKARGSRPLSLPQLSCAGPTGNTGLLGPIILLMTLEKCLPALEGAELRKSAQTWPGCD